MADAVGDAAVVRERPEAQTWPPLSVVIVTFRNGATLPGALMALQQAAPPGTELLVVENGGDRGVEAVAQGIWPGAKVVVNAENVGFAAGVNQGIRQATGPALLLLNPDAEVEPTTISTLFGALDRLPDAGIVAPRILAADGQPVLSCYPFLTPFGVAWRHLQISQLLPDVSLGRYRRATLAPSRTEPVPVDWAQGACWLVRREMLERVGLLDEDFFLYAEEVDLARRSAQAGWKTYLIPTAQVRHAEGSSSGQVVPLKLASHYISKAVYFSKHHGPRSEATVRTILLLDLSLRMVYRAVGVARSRPPDARQRLAAYATIARLLLTRSPAQLVQAWHTLARPST